VKLTLKAMALSSTHSLTLLSDWNTSRPTTINTDSASYLSTSIPTDNSSHTTLKKAKLSLPMLMELMKSTSLTSPQPSLKIPRPAELHSLTALISLEPWFPTAPMTWTERSDTKMLTGDIALLKVWTGSVNPKSGWPSSSPSEHDLSKPHYILFPITQF
jgi:hypothetical protein